MKTPIVECPVCEQKFHIPEKGEHVICPTCNRKLEVAKLQTIEAPPTNTLRPSPSAQVTFESGAFQKKDLARKATDAQANAKPETGDAKPKTEIGNFDFLAPDETPSESSGLNISVDVKPKTDSNRWLMGMIAAAIFVAIAGVALVIRSQTSLSSAAAEPAASADSAELKEDSSKVAAQPNPELDQDTAPRDSVSEKPPAKDQQKLFFYKKKRVDELWRTTAPHLVSLSIEGASGKQNATGVIVDSRGWVLTSYHAIKDAWEIEVAACSKSLEDLKAKEPLQDLARGIIAIDPEKDLALLAVNRRFVISFADIKLYDEDRIVQGEFLLQSAPPSVSNPYCSNEVKVDARGKFSTMKPGILQTATNKGLNVDDTICFAFDQVADGLPGTPLFREDGVMVAMLSFTNQGMSCAVPVNHVKSLITSADGKIDSFKVPVTVSEAGNQQVIPPDSPARALVVDLNLAGEKCLPFNFFPKDISEYSNLQKFAKHVIAATEFRLDYPNETGHQLVEDCLRQWEEKLGLSAGVTISKERDRLEVLNSLAKRYIKKGDKTDVVFFGSVYVSGIASDKLILKFDKQEIFVRVPFDPGMRTMLPGTKWLFFVRTGALANRIKIDIPQEGVVPAESATLVYALGPVR